jgi:hypothetical protein
MAFAEITETPGLFQPGAIAGLAGHLRTGMEAAIHRAEREVAALSPEGIGPTWTVHPLSGVGVASWTVQTTHPGAAPLNNGATWPGAWPLWGPDSPLAIWAARRGIPPFLVARKLKRDGLKARHFVELAFANVKDEMVDLVQRQGLHAFLETLPRG